jgi:hypothetical protein
MVLYRGIIPQHTNMKALTWLFSFSLLAPTGKVINFDTFALGKQPPGWTVSMTSTGTAPRWEIVKDITAPTQPYVLAQTSTDSNAARSPMAIFDGANLRDADVSVRIKPVSGHNGEAGGVVWRYKDANNYYLVRANALENNIAVYKVENGHRIPLMAGVKHQISANAWCILKVSVRGDKFQVFLDHRRVMEGHDATFTGPGKMGLWTMADSVTYFDDFRIYPK